MQCVIAAFSRTKYSRLHPATPDGNLDGALRERVTRGADEYEVTASAGSGHLPREDSRHPGIFVNVGLHGRKKVLIGRPDGRLIGRLAGKYGGNLSDFFMNM